jgi:hypothetical protein
MQLELVLEGLDKMSDPGYGQVCHQGVPMLVERTGQGRVRVARLLSTDPADYLKAQYVPGSILEY